MEERIGIQLSFEVKLRIQEIFVKYLFDIFNVLFQFRIDKYDNSAGNFWRIIIGVVEESFELLAGNWIGCKTGWGFIANVSLFGNEKSLIKFRDTMFHLLHALVVIHLVNHTNKEI